MAVLPSELACMNVTAEGIRLSVRVSPRASRTAITGLFDGALAIALHAPPVDGEANAALIAFLSKLLNVRKKQCRIVVGETSRNKIIAIDGDPHLLGAALITTVRELR